MVDAARLERARGRRAVVTNRELWVAGVRWWWDEKKLGWKVGKGKVESEMEVDGSGRLRGEELNERNEGGFGETGY